MIGYLILNWKALDFPGSRRNEMLIFMVLIILFNLMFGMRSENVDNWGHLGGVITGFLSGIVFLERMNPPGL